jgi:putative transposase
MKQTPVGQGFSPANRKFKKRTRLPDFSYKGTYRYFVTLCANNKRSVFNNVSVVSYILDLLKENAKIFGFRVWAYCFMPDHLHLLVEGENERSDFRKFISSFKQSSSFGCKEKYGLRPWQINYYEHVLRREEDTNTVANYIFNNPVRRGIVEDYREYAQLGSFEFDVTQT